MSIAAISLPRTSQSQAELLAALAVLPVIGPLVPTVAAALPILSALDQLAGQTEAEASQTTQNLLQVQQQAVSLLGVTRPRPDVQTRLVQVSQDLSDRGVIMRRFIVPFDQTITVTWDGIARGSFLQAEGVGFRIIGPDNQVLLEDVKTGRRGLAASDTPLSGSTQIPVTAGEYGIVEAIAHIPGGSPSNINVNVTVETEVDRPVQAPNLLTPILIVGGFLAAFLLLPRLLGGGRR